MRFVYCLLMITLFTNCQTGFNTEQVGQAVDIGGVWVNSEYIRLLRETQSPRAVQDSVNPTLILMPETIGDTGGVIWNFHDGTQFALGISGNTLGHYSLDYQGHYGDFEVVDKRLIFENKEFTYFSDSRKDFRVGEKYLFSGAYSWGDRVVSFAPDGTISGLDSFTRYAVMHDYFDAGRNLDQVEMGSDAKSLKPYGFAFTGDTLVLYRLTCIESDATTCYTVAPGETLFRLIKQ